MGFHAAVLTENDSLLDARALVPRDPGDLNRAWKAVRDASKPGRLTNPNHIKTWVAQNEIKRFEVRSGESEQFATAEYYGCTVFVVVTGRSIHIGHMSGERGQVCPLAKPETADRYLVGDIEEKIGGSLAQDIGDCKAAYVVVTGNVANKQGTGVPVLLDYFTDDLGIPKENVRYIQYAHSTALSEFGDPPDDSNPTQGRSSFQWESFGGPFGGTWKLYLSNETPRLMVSYDKDGNLDTGKPVEWFETGATSKPQVVSP
ncbi:hypothetical protein PG997_000573 [Apiospora hydei]|uniref:Uncharacterized protein n=1 Tax=Apiospora hydei TaxID=1337664 RepID=A0ABR1XBC2_9PEZI